MTDPRVPGLDDNNLLPTAVRAAMASALVNPATVEGAALAGAFAAPSQVAAAVAAEATRADGAYAPAGATGGSTPSLAPVFIETRNTGLAVTSPANLRTGLPTTTYTSGGFTDELVIAVTGTKGSAVLTATTDAAKVAALGSNPFAATLNAADGTNDTYVTVLSNNGTNQVTLRKALTADFVGTLSPKYDSALGQHQTKKATRAYAQHCLATTGTIGARGRIMAGEWELRPSTYHDVWALNAASVAYGAVNSAAPIVRTDLTVQSTHNVIGFDNVEINWTPASSGILVGTHKQGHGAVGTVYTGRRDSVLEFLVSAYRSTATSIGFIVHVNVTADGVVVLDQDIDGWANHFRLPMTGVDKVVVNVTNNNVTDTPYYLSLSNLTLREAGTSGRIGKGKIVTMGDSWFGFYDGEFAKALRTKSGATVVDHSLGGMTTQWALAWLDTYVIAEKPDEAWFHFFTNDDNQVTGNFTAPDGSSQLLWPAGLTAAQSLTLWRQNILTIIARCQRAGIRPVIIMPGGTASTAQAQRHCSWASNLELPALIDGWVTTTTELADVAAYVNTVGKRIGARAQVGAAPKYAAGPLPADAWS